MSTLDWNSTPPEILQAICEHLDPFALKALRLVSRQIYLAASAPLFRTVYINVLSREQLQLDVDYLSNTLTRSSCLESVYHLRIDGILPLEREDKGELRQGPIRQWKEGRLEQQWRWHRCIGYDGEAHRILDEDHAWLPLARLITLLPALREIVFACKNQFSPCLLEALHQTHSSRCRLHLETFCLGSHNRPDLQVFEYRLITSPHLEGIATEHYRDARVALALAPMLKSLYLNGISPPPSIENFMQASDWVTTTNRLVSVDDRKEIRRRCPLVRLQLCQEHFDKDWDGFVDLSLLRTLILDKPIEEGMLSWLAAKAPFKSLCELKLSIDCWAEQDSRESYSEAFSSFIYSVSPLRSLRIWANPLAGNIFTAILGQHGASLRQLSLWTFGHLESLKFNAFQVQEMSRRCPSLRELEIGVPRSKGDKAEQAIYTALGSMSQLQHLRLGLNCDNRTCLRTLSEDEFEIFNNPSWDEYLQQFFPVESSAFQEVNPRNGHVMDMLVNCALDATLAQEIFHCISSGKKPGAQRLETLQVFIRGGGFFGEPNVHHPADAYGVMEVVSRIAKAWKLARNFTGNLEVKEIDRCDEWGDGLATGRTIRLSDPDQDILTAQVEPVVRRLWPGSGNWLEEWHSFPLEGFERDNKKG
ncbi:hypothetical protein BKA64DRAFT_745528 [Cadophora sp. MPI-SDFR-AT-0126]|nr:hypothetical protein BKA64DRAFT_745528 [Leotiomycetes sp. MPI-SDFR-AT-0126]